jgi:predicted dienelactone hydrolase
MVVHLVTEKHRWQMFPAYILFVLAFLFWISSVFGLWVTRLPDLLRILLALTGIMLWFTAVFISYRIPIFRLPPPTGPYSVGTTFYPVENDVSAGKSQSPNIVFQVWYPAQSEDGRPAPYLPHAPFLWDWLRLVKTQSILDAPPVVEDGPYPVLFFGHGGGFIAAQNTIQMQELASYGYVVCSLSHPIDSAVTVYPDGSNDGRSFLQAWREMRPALTDNNKAFATAAMLKDSFKGSAAQLAEKKAVMQQILAENRTALAVIERRTNDTLAVIQFLVDLQNGKTDLFLADIMDLNNIGAFGHSNGGAVAINAAMQTERIKAVLNMDGYPFGDILDTNLQQPYLSMSREGAEGRDEVILAQAVNEAYRVSIKGTAHLNFMDLYLWFRQPISSSFGSINSKRAVEIMNAYTLAFFDKHLKNEAVPLIKGPSFDYPEVIFEVYD